MKKLFIISGSFFLLVLAFLAVYNFAFKHNTADPIADPKKKEEIEKKRAAESEAVTRSVAFIRATAHDDDDTRPVAAATGAFTIERPASEDRK